MTRGCEPGELDERWKNGPSFLTENEEKWPIKHCYSGQELPDQVVMAVDVAFTSGSCKDAVDISRFSSYDKLIRVTARIQNVFGPCQIETSSTRLKTHGYKQSKKHYKVRSNLRL